MDVDFVVNCYERTYRDVLAPGHVFALASQQHYGFSTITVLVNNVADRLDATRRADVLLAEDDRVARVVFVADRLAGALEATGVRRRSIRRLPHFTDCCLVAVTLDGPEFVVYWDADATLDDPCDWISPSLEYMREHPDVVVANPEIIHEGLAEREALRIDGRFAVGFGFSDVVFLTRRSELGRRVYRYLAPASWRYPLVAVEPIFEQRVDAYMRRAGRLRATFLGPIARHPTPGGLNYPTAAFRERVRGSVFRRLGRVASRSAHPALRAWPDAPPAVGAQAGTSATAPSGR